MTQDTYKEKVEALQQVMEESHEFLSEKLKERGVEGLKFIVIPLPEETCVTCAAEAVTTLLKAVCSKKPYLMVSGDYPFLDSLMNSLRNTLIEREDYEGVRPLDQLEKDIKSGDSHYLGAIIDKKHF